MAREHDKPHQLGHRARLHRRLLDKGAKQLAIRQLGRNTI